MAVPLTLSVKDSAGAALTAQEIIKGIIKTLSQDSPLAPFMTGPTAEAVLDDGQIARYRYFKDYFVGDQEESVIFNAIKAGGTAVATDFITDEVKIDLDDSRTTKPKIIRSQDEQALQTAFANYAPNAMKTIDRRRQTRWFEEVRLKTKANAALTDGITRVVDTTAVTTDEAYVKLVQTAISQMIDHFDDIFTVDTGDALGMTPELLIGGFKHNILTKMSNYFAKEGGSGRKEQLEKGAIEILSQVQQHHLSWKDGIDGAIMVRGSLMMPLGNIEKVEDKVGNFTKQWVRWDMPKQGSVEQLFSYMILFGDPAKINA